MTGEVDFTVISWLYFGQVTLSRFGSKSSTSSRLQVALASSGVGLKIWDTKVYFWQRPLCAAFAANALSASAIIYTKFLVYYELHYNKVGLREMRFDIYVTVEQAYGLEIPSQHTVIDITMVIIINAIISAVQNNINKYTT